MLQRLAHDSLQRVVVVDASRPAAVNMSSGLSRYDHLLARDAAMIFRDSVVQALDLNQPARMQELIEIHLCGHSKLQELSDSDQQLLEDFVAKAVPAGITFQQLNELLLVLNQDRVFCRVLYLLFWKRRRAPYDGCAAGGSDQVQRLCTGMLREFPLRLPPPKHNHFTGSAAPGIGTVLSSM
jgi:hypothetical protein